MANARSAAYHTVCVGPNLPEVDRKYPCDTAQQLPPADFWTPTLGPNDHVVANGPHTSICRKHAIFSAFLYAYNSHEDIVLSPDDIWIMICIYFSKYVNDNAEKLRSLFVDHDGQQTLMVRQETDKPDWDYFLQNMRVEIGKNVKNDVVELLTSNFSTTTRVESLLSCATIMSVFKQYFKYVYSMCRCGIRNVHFMGTLDDWKVLRQKAEQLKNFAILDQGGHGFSGYIDGLLPILDQFIETYQGNVDYQFWNTVMDIQHRHGMSGIKGGEYVNGWFLKLCYGSSWSEQRHIDDIKLDSITVPVIVFNKETRETKDYSMMGGFHGVESSDGCHKPVMSLAFVEQISEKEQKPTISPSTEPKRKLSSDDDSKISRHLAFNKTF